MMVMGDTIVPIMQGQDIMLDHQSVLQDIMEMQAMLEMFLITGKLYKMGNNMGEVYPIMLNLFQMEAIHRVMFHLMERLQFTLDLLEVVDTVEEQGIMEILVGTWEAVVLGMVEEDTMLLVAMMEAREEDLIHVVDIVQEEDTIVEVVMEEVPPLMVIVVNLMGIEVGLIATEVDIKVVGVDLMAIEAVIAMVVAVEDTI